MKVERVSRELLRMMGVGATATFELPNFAKVESAQVQIALLSKRDGIKFTQTTDGCTMKVTRIS